LFTLPDIHGFYQAPAAFPEDPGWFQKPLQQTRLAC
jgi:hypothetical protein